MDLYKLAQTAPSPPPSSVRDFLSRLTWRHYIGIPLLGLMAAPIAYRLVTRPFTPDRSSPDLDEVLGRYGRLLQRIETQYPSINLLVGGLLGAGLGAAYSKLSGKEGISPILLGALLGAGTGYAFRD